jgi:hypothetical protein
MPPKLNAAWHKAHVMPPNPTMAQRIAWHRAHADACGCRPVPQTVQAAMRATPSPRRRRRGR